MEVFRKITSAEFDGLSSLVRFDLADTGGCHFGRARFASGTVLPGPDEFRARDAQDFIILVDGAIRFEFPDDSFELKAGDAIYMDRGQEVRIIVNEDSEAYWIFIGDDLEIS